MSVPRLEGGMCMTGRWPVDLWTSAATGARAAAQHVCEDHCPIRDACRDWAVTLRPLCVVMGGIVWTTEGRPSADVIVPDPTCWVCSPESRKPVTAIRPGQRRLAPCGTRGAYERHLRYGEPVDVDCRDAHRKYSRERARKVRADRRPA